MSEEKVNETTSPPPEEEQEGLPPGMNPEDVPVKIDAKATIEWLDDDGNSLDPPQTEQVLRSMPCIYKHLKAIYDKNKLKGEHQVRVCLTGDNMHGNQVEVELGRGPLAHVIVATGKRIMPAQIALKQLQVAVMQLADVSELKGVVLTAVLGDGHAAGFGMLSDSIEVTDEDISVLGSAAANQADLFKKQMREKRGVQFPDDSPIIPARMVPSGLKGKIR
jgi:hypothetical protein